VKRVAVYGIGYVGCVTAACLSRDGHDVIGVDVDNFKVDTLNAGKSPVAEHGLDDLVSEQVRRGRLRGTTSVTGAVAATEMGLVAVGTPSGADGSVSLAAVENVLTEIGRALHDSDQPYVVTIRSTILPGILEDRLGPLLENASGRRLGDGLLLNNNPEFLREGSAIADYQSPPYVVVGTLEGDDGRDVLELYRSVQAEKVVTDTRTAALLKYACNCFHAAKVAFANEIGTLAKSLGADGVEVMDLVCRDTKLNVSKAYLRPGFAFGGSCLPKDLRAVVRYAEQHAVRLSMLKSILSSNQEHLQRAIDTVLSAGERDVGMAGLSFKPGTDDLRESPFVTLAEQLIGRGCRLKIYDPSVSIARLRGRNLAYIDQHLPHLAAQLVETADELFAGTKVLLLNSAVADTIPWKASFSGEVVDLRTQLVQASVRKQAGR
jgi:GDP-mannose 6-dehydrogenase